MVAGKNYNIQTACKNVVGKGSNVIIGGVVATGLKRYVTFVRVSQIGVKNSAVGGSRVLFCSVSVTTAVHTMASASANQKLSIGIVSTTTSQLAGKVVNLPSQPNTENPLFSIAAGNWLAAKLGSSAGVSIPCTVFVQYYDQ